MRMRTVLSFLLVIVCTSSCVTPKAQIDDAPIAPAASVTPVAGNEHVMQTEDGDWLAYEPSVVELRGKLVTKMYYGPPNYGEDPKTDAKEVLPFLDLIKPVNVHGYPDSNAGPPEQATVRNVGRVQLVLTIPHKDKIGKNVIVTGTLFHAFTGHHHTDVLMSVQSIRLAGTD